MSGFGAGSQVRDASGLVCPAVFAVRPEEMALDEIGEAVRMLREAAGRAVDRTDQVVMSWGRLRGCYQAPEAPAALAFMDPVRDMGGQVAACLRGAADAVEEYEDELTRLRGRLFEVVDECEAFRAEAEYGVWQPAAGAVVTVSWDQDPHLVARNEALVGRYTALLAGVGAAAERCAQTLDGLPGLDRSAYQAGPAGLLGAVLSASWGSASLPPAPDRAAYASDDMWALAFEAWARALPDDEAGRGALRRAVAGLSAAEMDRLLVYNQHCTTAGTFWTGPDFLAPLLVRTDLSGDPVYGDLYSAVQRFPDPAHHTYDPNDARDTKAAAAAVAAAWAALTPQQRTAATRMYPWLVGSADGVGTVHRDKANRQVLAIELATTSTELQSIDAELERLGPPARSGQYDWYVQQNEYTAQRNDLLVQRGQLTARLDFLTEVNSLIQPAKPGDGEGERVNRYLVLLDPDADGTGSTDKTGRAAVAWGNPDEATNVGIVVPGMNTFASDVSGGDLRRLVQDAGNLYATTDRLLVDTPSKSVATVAWIGYDAPGMDSGVFTDKKAHEGAFSLAAYEWGLEEAHRAETGKSPTMTTLAHSYGSVVAGAATHHDNPNDNLVVFGSPGTTVDHASELDIPDGHVYKALAKADDIDLAGNLQPFGNQPAGNLPLGDVVWGGIRIKTTGSSGHSQYMNLDTESLMNMSRVVAGQYDKVTTVEPSVAYDEHGRRVPNPQPGPPGGS